MRSTRGASGVCRPITFGDIHGEIGGAPGRRGSESHSPKADDPAGEPHEGDGVSGYQRDRWGVRGARGLSDTVSPADGGRSSKSRIVEEARALNIEETLHTPIAADGERVTVVVEFHVERQRDFDIERRTPTVACHKWNIRDPRGSAVPGARGPTFSIRRRTMAGALEKASRSVVAH